MHMSPLALDLWLQGAWGFWYLPGDPSFHVNWTGVAEIAGGAGCVLGALNLSFVPDWVLPASAFGLFLLTVVVRAPGPQPARHLAVCAGAMAVQVYLYSHGPELLA